MTELNDINEKLYRFTLSQREAELVSEALRSFETDFEYWEHSYDSDANPDISLVKDLRARIRAAMEAKHAEVES